MLQQDFRGVFVNAFEEDEHTKSEEAYHDCHQNGRTDDPPVIHIYILPPAPEKKNINGKRQPEMVLVQNYVSHSFG